MFVSIEHVSGLVKFTLNDSMNYSWSKHPGPPFDLFSVVHIVPVFFVYFLDVKFCCVLVSNLSHQFLVSLGLNFSLTKEHLSQNNIPHFFGGGNSLSCFLTHKPSTNNIIYSFIAFSTFLWGLKRQSETRRQTPGFAPWHPTGVDWSMNCGWPLPWSLEWTHGNLGKMTWFKQQRHGVYILAFMSWNKHREGGSKREIDDQYIAEVPSIWGIHSVITQSHVDLRHMDPWEGWICSSGHLYDIQGRLRIHTSACPKGPRSVRSACLRSPNVARLNWKSWTAHLFKQYP